MKSTSYFQILLLLIVASFLASCSASAPENDKKARVEKLKKEQATLQKEIQKLEAEILKENPDSASVRAKEVGVTQLAQRQFDHYVKTQGRVESENNIQVSAKAMGVVTNVYVTEGQKVSKGQVLAQIDNSVIAQNIASMKSQLELARSVYDRQKNLWDQKIGTEVQFLQSKANKEGLERQLAALQEQSAMARITSPISGTVDAVNVKVGENIAPGVPAVRVVNGNDLTLQANVSEAFVTMIKKGNKVVVEIPEIKKNIEAKVTFVGRNIDPLSRTFPIEVTLPNDADLRPNMTATIKIIYRTEPSAVVVPVNVIQTLNNEKIVYVAETMDKVTIARKKVVKIDGVYDGMAQVDGLKNGDKVITTGYQGLSDGEVIKI